jgi:hypothetical protein
MVALRTLAVVALASASVSAARATSIVAIRTPTIIVIGGDSKYVAGTDAGLICKVRVANDVAYGESGILWVPSRNFVASDIVGHTADKEGSLSARVALFEKDIVEPLTSLSNELKGSDPPGYIKLVKDKVVFSIVFAAMEDHVTKLMMRYWTASERDGKVVLTMTGYACPGDCATGLGYMALGDGKDAAEAEMAKHPDIWKSLGLEVAVRHLVEDGIVDRPDTVGPPVEVLSLSDGGFKWIEDRGSCTDRK